MLAATDRVSELVTRTDRETFNRDWVIQDALIRELEILGEAAGRVSVDLIRAHPEIPWREVTGMRHKLVHDYFFVDLDIVWQTASVDIPEIAPMLKSIAAEVSGAEPK
ncbi:MAG: HepT-like ribonuclease domain-containing protein [Gemmatimonadota bacterium]